MLVQGKGIMTGSEEFHLEPGEIAKRLLYYVTDCGVYFCDYGYKVERENYGNYMMLYVSQGILSVSTADDTYLVKEGQVAFINCYEPHEYHAKVFTTFFWIHFDGVNVRDFYEEYVTKRKEFTFRSRQTEQLRKNISYVISCYQNDVEINEVEHSKLLYSCLCTLIFLESNDGMAEFTNMDAVNLAKEYIQKHIGEELTLDIVAGYVGLSASHFSRIFKKETGCSPYKYIISVRLNWSKHLLKTTNKAIKEIASEVGYRSESNFCNAFTRREGVAPASFRKYNI